jgi:hypothetical protein
MFAKRNHGDDDVICRVEVDGGGLLKADMHVFLYQLQN